MKVIGMNLLMNRACAFFLLLLLCGKVNAQLNTFESGQTIRADEMNENFETLSDDIDDLQVDLIKLNSSTNDKINQNYNLLLEQIDILSATNARLEAELVALTSRVDDLTSSGGSASNVACTRDTVAGRWLLTDAPNYEWETLTVYFYSDGTIRWYDNLAGTANDSDGYGSFSVNSQCRIDGEFTISGGGNAGAITGWLSNDGNNVAGLVYSYVTGRWGAGTLIRRDL